MRTSVVLASVCLLASLGFAGCAESGDDLSASNGLSKAKAKAAAWNEDPILVATFAIEASDVELLEQEMRSDGEEISDFDGLVDALTVRSDRSVGDGRAPAWIYVFVHEQGVAFVVVGISGTTLHLMEAGSMAKAATVLPIPTALLAAQPDPADFGLEWKIDSVEAASILRASSESFDALVAGGVGNVSWELGADFDGGSAPAWSVYYEAGDTFGVAAIDAMTGEVLSDGPIDGVIPGLHPESGVLEGSVDVLTPMTLHTFEITQEGHPSLEVRLQPYLPSTGQAVVRVSGPDGSSAEGRLLSAGVYSMAPIQVDAPAAGNWTVEVELEAGALIEYSGSWCAAGMASVPGSC